MSLNNIDMKVKEFSWAIEKYNTLPFYTRLETALSIMVIFLQILTVLDILPKNKLPGLTISILMLVFAYLATDFFNGLIHMMVDNNTHYTSFVGPFVAAFHMHHYKLQYNKKNAFVIYFYESGRKYWLVIYLLLLACTQKFIHPAAVLNLGLVAFGLFSSLAEVSHYWCHNTGSNHAFVSCLQKYRLLLSMKHHRVHHMDDNMNYAFLNGLSDPLLNVIARYFYQGYKNQSDKHVAAYIRSKT